MDFGERTDLTRGARAAAAAALAALAGFAVLAPIEPRWAGWTVFGVAVAGFLALTLDRSRKRLPDGESDPGDVLEVLRDAIRRESDRLDTRRAEMEKRLMAYGEWMEFPDFDELREANWAVAGRSAQDAEVAELLDAEAERMMKRASDGAYWVAGTFQSRILLAELMEFVQQIAKVYQPDSERPFLETNLESIFKAVNRASLQVILLLEEMPIVGAQEWNLRKIADGVRTASKVYENYEWVKPFLDPMRYLWHGSKLLLVSNPLSAAGWIAGSELLWRGGKNMGKRALNSYLLSLVRQTLGIIAWETASIFDSTHRYRNPDFVYGVELAHLVSRFPMDQDTLRNALKELGRIPFRSTFDRVFLYRCVAQHVSPRPERFCQAELMEPATRQSIAARLEAFRTANVPAAPGPALTRWRRGVAERLDIPHPEQGEPETDRETGPPADRPRVKRRPLSRWLRSTGSKKAGPGKD